ncbi:glycosyl hydrolase family 28-related protein [Bradyrhizobium sp. UNPA324]|uniref:glycosyl hydrolase family 28-related protein n=1 Tax=Bradyrhizobium sp. UNPA324 TaxID=1141174 RepID=UPI00114E2B16|nr:glycosyl hydrolase family 28-related protein [Bradyrhizobium sp. UNPA324]
MAILVSVLVSVLASGEPAFADSTILWASDPVSPDETVLVVGDGLERIERVFIERMSDSPDVISKSVQSSEVKTEQVSSASLKFTIPKDFSPGVYRFNLRSNDNTTQYLNAPSIYWMQGNGGRVSSPGGWLRIFGRNIGRTSDALVRLESSADRSIQITLKASRASLWEASFTLPDNLSLGSYNVRLWNGNGDANTWRDAGTLQVESKASPPALQLDAKELGARGDGEHDDTSALLDGLATVARRGGGTLWMPRGYYKLSAALVIPPGVHLRGEDQKLVRLVWSELPNPPYALIEGSSNFGIESLTIFAGNHAHIISGGFQSGSNVGLPDAENITIQRVTVRASMYRGHLSVGETADRLAAALKSSSGGPDTLRLSGKNLTVEDCDLYGSGRSLYLQQPRNARIERNRLYNGRWGWYSISGADRVIFENNEVTGADLQSTGGGINTLGKIDMFAQNVAFLHNRLQMMNGWDREAMTSDGPGGCYYGRVAAISHDRRVITLVPPTSNVVQDLERCVGAGMFVLGGRGIGQVRRIQSIEGQTIRIEDPLTAPLDSSSVISITTLQRNYLVVGNVFSDTGIAVQLFGSAVEHVIAENVSRRTGGFLSRGLLYRQFQPTWYNQFLNNRIEEGDSFRDAILAVWGSQKSPNAAPLSLATIIRSNVLAAGSHIEIRGYTKIAPGVRDVIVEGNHIQKQDGAILVDEGAIGVLLRKNTTEPAREAVANGR